MNTLNDKLSDLRSRLNQVILGKSEVIDLVLTCIFARGHLLLEDVPGTGKTTLAKGLAEGLGLSFSRVQCTNDMLPADITGISVYNQKEHNFDFFPGPIFSDILLADEINRATPKTQSALLEAMEEYQVTIDGRTHELSYPFFVIATQNPFEQAGTYPLPESQLDRFLMKISIGYPDKDHEIKLLENGGALSHSFVEQIMTNDEIREIMQSIDEVHASGKICNYIQRLLEFSRKSGDFKMGLSPRAGLAILKTAKSFAYLNESDHVLPEHVQSILPHVATHRLLSNDNQGSYSKDQIQELFKLVPLDK